MTTKPPEKNKKKFLVTHNIVQTPVALTDYLTNKLNLPPTTARFLLSLGAVYINETRVTGNPRLQANDYLRVHHEPKRFPADKIDWKSTILFENSDMLVIDKPYGMPVHATLDNAQENVIHQISQGLPRPLLVTHRIDIGTSGVLIIAKNAPAQKNINEQFAFKKVRKFYSAIVTREIATGIYTHYMKRDPRAPKILSREAQINYKKCDLEVISCKPLNEGLFRVEIELFTGRSHQIRAQFALLDSPILGDVMYGGPPHKAPRYLGEFYFLSSTRLKIFDFDFTIPFSLALSVQDKAAVSLPKTLF